MLNFLKGNYRFFRLYLHFLPFISFVIILLISLTKTYYLRISEIFLKLKNVYTNCKSECQLMFLTKNENLCRI